MGTASKILWSEGLTLGPQQFQQQDRYHELRLQRVASALNAYCWGLRAVRWNADELVNHRLSADAISLIFPDGEVIDAPAEDDLPPAIDLSSLPVGETSVTFFVAVPRLRSHGSNLENGSRFRQVDVDTADLFTDAVSIDVSYLRKSLRLLSHLEARDAFVSFPAIRLTRRDDGGFDVDPAFMPPAVSIGAMPALTLILAGLVAKMEAKIDILYRLHRQSHKGTLEVHSGDISSYWMLNTICTSCATLKHFEHSMTQHPETLFEKLCALAGGLMSLSNKRLMSDLPAYDHEKPEAGFHALDTIIRDLLDTAISSKYFTIPLVAEENRKTHYCGKLDAARIAHDTQLCLAVSADMPALELVGAVPRLFKIGSPDSIERIVVSALPGAEITHMAQVPSSVPVRPNTYYFSITGRGALYEDMIKSQAITIYVPAGMKSLRLDLFALTD